MLTTTTHAPQFTPRGIPLNKTEFKKAITKAENVRPRVVHIGAHYGVAQSDGRSFAEVVFIVQDARLFATCTCYAHTGRFGERHKPQPCYHIAAAALSRKWAAEFNDHTPDAETLSEIEQATREHFSQDNGDDRATWPLRKPESADRYQKEGWEL